MTSVVNLKVTAEINETGVVLLYKVEEGITDQSFGLNVAELAKFPRSVIELAEKKIKLLKLTEEFSKEEIEAGNEKLKAGIFDETNFYCQRVLQI